MSRISISESELIPGGVRQFSMGKPREWEAMSKLQSAMHEIKSDPGIPPAPSTDGLRVGAKVRLLKDIWDDGEDHHPPGCIAHAGEVLLIRRVHDTGARRSLGVSHEHITGNSFTVYAGEYETYNSN